MTILVTGASGFIGHHLCNYLAQRGHHVRAVDYKPPAFPTRAEESDWRCDLRRLDSAIEAVRGCSWVFALAADMGGMGYIGYHHWEILHNNLLINLNTARACELLGVQRVLYTSSACVYPEQLQGATSARELAESDAWQGKPDTAYGVEKLVAEDLYTHMGAHAGVEVRIARFHNIYGEECAWRGGREKAPAALCRKVAQAKRIGQGEIEIWGDGEQTRSFCHISDCLTALWRLMESDYDGPLNIGTDELTTINGLVDLIAGHAGITLGKRHDLSKPQGVRGRNADLTRMRLALDYTPRIPLQVGIGRLYDWIEYQEAHAL